MKFRARDTDYGVTRSTLKAMSKATETSETMVVHLALSRFAREVLPAYEPDDGPLSVSVPITINAHLTEQQLMNWRLEIAPAGSTNWQTLVNTDAAASSTDQTLTLTTLNPATLQNGVYEIRLSASDLQGRTREINARVIIDSASKSFGTQRVTDATVVLGGHTLALTRQWDDLWSAGTNSNALSNAFSNWKLPLLDTQLTSDQPATLDSGATAPWRDGAKVWVTLPDSLGSANAGLVNLTFTLNAQSERLNARPGAPLVWHPAFSGTAGWSLQAYGANAYSDRNDNTATPDALTRQGAGYYDQALGLPWVPASFMLTGPDGTQYLLDSNGKIVSALFTDGVRWQVSDAGVAAVTGDTTARLDILRDSAGRIAKVTYPLSGVNTQGTATAIAYRYDSQGRLILARELGGASLGNPVAYDAAGHWIADPITANLGAAVNWNTGNNAWSGALNNNTSGTTNLIFSVRESELASTVHVPGGQGAVIVALETGLPAGAQIEISGAQIIGTATLNGKTTQLLRVTEAGVKVIRISGAGQAQVRVSLAGDLNHDGKVDGADSALWQQAGTPADINGDGQLNSADRQVLYANTGFRANQAPVAGDTLTLKAHTDLDTQTALAGVADDLEGDTLYWRVLGATHGTAKLSADGQLLLFTPEVGYAGQAAITVQADDGFAAGAPIVLTINVSGAALRNISSVRFN